MVAIINIRRFRRFELLDSPVFMEVAGISPVMLEAENISWAGFEGLEGEMEQLGVKVKSCGLLRYPRPGMSLICELEIGGEVFPGLVAAIPWAAREKRDLAEWTFGLQISVSTDQAARFRQIMRRSFPDLCPRYPSPQDAN